MKTDTNIGTLYGIGVGPGDPDLLTLKAIKILKRVNRVFTAASTKNTYSLAVNIAKPHLVETATIVLLPFPMTNDEVEKQDAWEINAKRIIDELHYGHDVAFLTLGDPMTYSTFGYIVKYIQAKAPHIHIETIPGITSYQAAAARINTPLVEGEEALLIVSGAKGGDHIRKHIGNVENVVLLKAYKYLEDIRLAFEESGFNKKCIAISHCGQDDEEIIEDIDALCQKKPDYWTLVIAKQRFDN
ncbi:MAG: precorrin-2 C(20)-methyltransferase [Desulfobacterales bacterium]|nr:precorrin-2 C(20)-methyltransferase [Desulfobacterales bacterium]